MRITPTKLLFTHMMRTLCRKPQMSQQTSSSMDIPESTDRPMMVCCGAADSKIETNNCLWVGAESHGPTYVPPGHFWAAGCQHSHGLSLHSTEAQLPMAGCRASGCSSICEKSPG